MPNSALNTTVKQTVLASNSRRFAPWTSLARALTLRLNCFLDLSNLSPVVVVRMVAQIEFTEWTPDGHLRHSKFVGLTEDKQAREVVREG